MSKAPTSRAGWTTVAFGDVVRLTTERSSNPESDGLERFVGLEHVEPGDLRIRRWGDIADGTTFTSVFRPGQVLFGKRRAYQRKVAVADFSGVCSGDIYVLEPEGKDLLPELLPFICQTDDFFEHAVGTSAGSLSPRTNWTSLSAFEFALPPIEEQRRIVEALQAIEQVGYSLQRAVRLRQTVRNSLLKRIWDRTTSKVSLGTLIAEGPQNGLYKPAASYGAGVPILRIDSFAQGKLTQASSWKRLTIDDEEATLYRLEEGDIVINRVNSRDLVGQCSIVGPTQEGAVFESNMMRFSVRPDSMRAELVAAFINHPQVQRQIVSRRKDAVNQSSINQGDVESLLIPKVSLSDQDRHMDMLRALDQMSASVTQRLDGVHGVKAKLLSSGFCAEVGR